MDGMIHGYGMVDLVLLLLVGDDLGAGIVGAIIMVGDGIILGLTLVMVDLVDLVDTMVMVVIMVMAQTMVIITTTIETLIDMHTQAVEEVLHYTTTI